MELASTAEESHYRAWVTNPCRSESKQWQCSIGRFKYQVTRLISMPSISKSMVWPYAFKGSSVPGFLLILDICLIALFEITDDLILFGRNYSRELYSEGGLSFALFLGLPVLFIATLIGFVLGAIRGALADKATHTRVMNSVLSRT